jgi:hypothetical protein
MLKGDQRAGRQPHGKGRRGAVDASRPALCKKIGPALSWVGVTGPTVDPLRLKMGPTRTGA